MSTPLLISSAGAVSASPQALQTLLLANVSALDPDYTANLPGILIEDISSTDVGAMVQIDQARVDAVNCMTPYASSPYVLAQQGQMLGIAQGLPTNTNCFVVISGNPGYYIPKGFIVSDGTYQYSVQDGGAIQTGSTTVPLYVVAIQAGTWAVPIGSITNIVTSVPSPYALTVTNAVAGIPGGVAQSVQSYRAQIMQATTAAAQGTPAFLLTQIQKVPGVLSRLTTIIAATSGWKILCGGGDPYAVAGAIYSAVLDLSTIVGSSTSIRNVNVTLTDYPNNYNVVYVNPPQQIVGVSAIWNTSLTNFAAAAQVDQLAQAAILSYVNSINVGQPLNIFALNSAFQQAVVSVLPINYLTTLEFSITINSTPVSPEAGTGIISTDAESYFEAFATGITVAQG